LHDQHNSTILPAKMDEDYTPHIYWNNSPQVRNPLKDAGASGSRIRENDVSTLIAQSKELREQEDPEINILVNRHNDVKITRSNDQVNVPEMDGYGEDQPVNLSSIQAMSSTELLIFPRIVNGKQVQVLIDGRAKGNFISSSLFSNDSTLY